jgi:hypothetical protein
MNLGSNLANQNVSSSNYFTAKTFNASALGVTVSTVS